jgi:Tfp pilus assembly protein PilO
MNQKPAKASYKEVIVKQLRQPLKLRLLISVGIMVAWYALFFSPLSDETTAATARITRERARVATARQIDQLKKSIAPFHGRVLVGADINELMRYVIAQMRSSPLKLLDLKPEKSKDLGPFETFGLKLTLEGTYAEIDEFLKWVETDERLLRVDAIKLDPLAKDPTRLTAQVVLLILAEKASPPAKAKPEVGKKK